MLIDDVDRYLRIRRTLGFDLHETERRLRSFATYAAERMETHVRMTTAVAWAASGPSPHARYIRFRDLTRFSQFVHGDDERHDLLYGAPFATRWRRPAPYIYSRDEVARLVSAAATALRPTWPERRLVVSTVLGLISATGLRVSEALALRVDDVHDCHIVVRMTKFRKSRIVPLHPTVQVAIGRYLAQRRRFAGTSDHLFVSQKGEPYPYVTLLAAFRQACRAAQIEPVGRRPPRIHDLRQTFATRALEDADAQRGEITQHHVALSTYLGHAHIHDTYWYMEATPELMVNISEAAEKLARGGRP